MTINMNEMVKVKLLPKGIEILEHEHADLMKDWPGCKPFSLPPVDENGYTSFLLWELMQKFGDYMFMGCTKLPFEMNIKIRDDEGITALTDGPFTNECGVTVRELKALVADLPDKNDVGEDFEVWVGSRNGLSNVVTSVIALNKRNDGCDVLLETNQ